MTESEEEIKKAAAYYGIEPEGMALPDLAQAVRSVSEDRLHRVADELTTLLEECYRRNLMNWWARRRFRRLRAQRVASFEAAPGAWMLVLAGTIFSNRTREHVFEQIVADFREEYCEALTEKAGRTRMAFVIGRHWAGFALAVVMQAGLQIAKVIKTLKGAG